RRRSAGTETEKTNLPAFRQGLREAGFVEGRTIAIEYRWADGNYERMPALAADLARRGVAVIATAGGPEPARAARAATATTPIVYVTGSDPVADGLVTSFNRPGGTVTGIHLFTTSPGSKRLEFIAELEPAARRGAFLAS